MQLSFNLKVHISIRQDLVDCGAILLMVIQHRLQKEGDFFGYHYPERRMSFFVGLVVVFALDFFEDIFFSVSFEREYSIEHSVKNDS